MSFVTLASAIKTVLDGISDITDVGAFAAVYDYPPNESELTGFPLAVAVDSDLQSEFDTTADNAREYAFSIFLIDTIEDPTSATSIKDAYQTMRKTVDKVIDTLDNNQTLSGNADWTFPAPTQMNVRVDLPNGEGLLAEVRLRVRKDFTTA